MGMMTKNKTFLKKTIRTALAAGMLATLLAGCAGATPAEPAETPVLETIPEEETVPEEQEAQEAETETTTEAEKAQQLLNPELEMHGEAPAAVADLSAAQAENPDAFAWLNLPGTELDTPIIQNLDGSSENAAQAVTLDPGNSTDFMDPNIILHGAAATEGDPFYPILAYGDPEYFDTHPYLYITADGMLLEYQVFAAYETEPEPLLMNYNCYDYDEYADYVNGVFDRRDMGMAVNESLRETALNAWSIITLEAQESEDTCRLVQAVLTGKQILE